MKLTEQYWGETFEIVTEPQPDGTWAANAVGPSQPAISAQGTTEQEAASNARTRIAEAIDRGRAQTGKR